MEGCELVQVSLDPIAKIMITAYTLLVYYILYFHIVKYIQVYPKSQFANKKHLRVCTQNLQAKRYSLPRRCLSADRLSHWDTSQVERPRDVSFAATAVVEPCSWLCRWELGRNWW